jgi:uncharacterized protein DUF6326
VVLVEIPVAVARVLKEERIDGTQRVPFRSVHEKFQTADHSKGACRMSPRAPLEPLLAPTGVVLALAWASLMSLYIYNDYFSMYLPGVIANMSSGHMGPLGLATPRVLVGVSILLAVPALMILLSVALPAGASRWLNIALGLAYTVVEALTFREPERFYRIVVTLEIALTLFIVWRALRWPRQVG